MAQKFGRYEATRIIARGGMATVYLGRAVADGGFERLVAIKVMHPHIAEQPEFEAMFLDEARLAASIRHPNVVATIDVSKAHDAMFLVMDYVDGPALNLILRRLTDNDQEVPVAITLRILIDTLNGLEAAHGLCDSSGRPLQLVHRDVSPQNILVGGDGIARLTDFGVARAEARLSLTTGGEIKGKLGYMPPEQSRGETIDCRADVYAAGVVLWECLTHERMFAADSAGELIFKVLSGVQRSPQEVNPNVPYHVNRVCMSALSLSVEHRYQSAADFAEALEQAALHDGVAVATARELGKFIESIRPLLDDDPDANTADSVNFSSVAAPSTNPSASGMYSGTGRPHSVSVETSQPSQSRMVTALAGVIALIVGVGGAGVLMLSEPVAADRLSPGITDPSRRIAHAGTSTLQRSVAEQAAAEQAAAEVERLRAEAERARPTTTPEAPEAQPDPSNGGSEAPSGSASPTPTSSVSSHIPMHPPAPVGRRRRRSPSPPPAPTGPYRPPDL